MFETTGNADISEFLLRKMVLERNLNSSDQFDIFIYMAINVPNKDFDYIKG